MSSIQQQIDRLQGERVRVESGEGHRFEGTLDRVIGDTPGVLLRDARELPGGAEFATVFVSEVDWIVWVSDDSQ